MNEQFASRYDDSSDAGRDRPPAPTDQFAPIQRFPLEQYPPEQYPTERFPTRPAAGRVEPLAHEGGLPYGNSPAAPYRPDQDFVPQHLAASPAFGNGPYGPGQYRPYLPQHLMPQPFMPQAYPMQPYPMQQTVFVANGGGRRVNHVLHLILTILTFGLWVPVWAVLAIANS